jgi:hypothetical protein
MYLNKNFKINEKVRAQIQNEGYFVIKRYFSKNIIEKINQQVEKLILDNNNFYPPRNIDYYKLNKKALRNPNGTLKMELDQSTIDKGYKFFSKFTNGVSYRDPLLKIRDLKKIVFKNKFINLMNYLFEKKCYFGPLKLATFFKNKLPKNCINFFHTDDLDSKGDIDHKSLKISIPLNIKNNEKTEYMHLPINKKKLGIKKQYFEQHWLEPNLRKKIISPKIELGDIIVFDPTNFFHAAQKPTRQIRNILYLEFVLNKKKRSKIKIYRKDISLLSKKQIKFCSSFIKV